MSPADDAARLAAPSTRQVTKAEIAPRPDGVCAEYSFYGGMVVVGVDAQGEMKTYRLSGGTYKEDATLFVGAQPGKCRVMRPQSDMPLAFVLGPDSNEFFGVMIAADFKAEIDVTLG